MGAFINTAKPRMAQEEKTLDTRYWDVTTVERGSGFIVMSWNEAWRWGVLFAVGKKIFDGDCDIPT